MKQSKETESFARESVKKRMEHITNDCIKGACEDLGLDRDNVNHVRVAKLYIAELTMLLTVTEIITKSPFSMMVPEAIAGIAALKDHFVYAVNEIYNTKST